ncbi:MAG: phosphoglucosamine mutase [Thermoplasmata archaeon]
MASKGGLFGTNGIRGEVNVKLTPEFILNSSLAIATFLNGNKTVIVGRDTRNSGTFVSNILKGALLSAGNHVYDAGIVPTPALQLAVKNHADFGIMVTASHNPPIYNGIKCIDGDGTELEDEKENEIERIFNEKSFKLKEWSEIGRYDNITGVNHNYVFNVYNNINKEIINKNLKIVVDCSSGAGSLTTPEFLDSINIKFTSLNCNIDGNFPAHDPEPKEENLKELIRITKGYYDFGAAHDGDADRIVFVDDDGNFIAGDKILGLFTKNITDRRNGIVVIPVTVSKMVEEIAMKNGSKVLYTKVGAPIVARTMMKVNAIFGGEDNGGLIFPEMQYARDGLMGLAKMIELISERKSKLSDLIKELPEYYQKKGSFKIPQGKSSEIMKIIERDFEKNTIKIDGIKIIEGDSWVLIRPSGTEPLIRLYAESKSRDDLENIFKKYSDLIENIIKEIQ